MSKKLKFESIVLLWSLSGMKKYGTDTKHSGSIKIKYFGKSWKTENQIKSKMRYIAKQDKENLNSSCKVGFHQNDNDDVRKL